MSTLPRALLVVDSDEDVSGLLVTRGAVADLAVQGHERGRGVLGHSHGHVTEDELEATRGVVQIVLGGQPIVQDGEDGLRVGLDHGSADRACHADSGELGGVLAAHLGSLRCW